MWIFKGIQATFKLKYKIAHSALSFNLILNNSIGIFTSKNAPTSTIFLSLICGNFLVYLLLHHLLLHFFVGVRQFEKPYTKLLRKLL